MLNPPTRLSHPALHIRPAAARGEPQWALHELFIGTRRQIAIILAATIVATSLGLIYLSMASPRYAAVAQLLIDTRRSRSPLDAPNSSVDASVIASQIETLKSETIARIVIGKLGLDKDPEFIEPTLISRIVAWLEVGNISDPQEEWQRRAIDRFARALDVVQAGRSYVAVVRFTSLNPEKAARITNAVCDAYIDDQLEAKSVNSARANLWFERRLNELGTRVDRANQALESFRSGNPGQLDSVRQGQSEGLVAAAQAQKQAYDTFQNLSRYSQTIEKQTFPATEARVLTWAEPPLTRSWPPIGLTLLFSLIAGCGLGMVVAYGSEHLSGTVRTRQHVERDLGVRCLGFLPLLTQRDWWRDWWGFGSPVSSKGDIPLLNSRDSLSDAGETLIGVRVALDARNHSSTGSSIGITSPRSGEGKTTVAVNLAKSIADSGKRVLLIDADLRSPSLTRVLAPQSRHGLPEVLRDALALTDLAVVPGLGFHVLPQPLDRIPARPPDILSSSQMREMLDSAKSIFDYVVLDLPPAIDHVDAYASASQLDHFVLVAEWGRTRITDLEAVWASSDHIAERMVGVIVNKAPRGYELR
jgi:capsular exopolysaccharide synthesis family protein